MTPREWWRRFRKGWDDGQAEARAAKAARYAPAIPHPGTRPRHGACPGCGAADGAWCRDDCTLLDLTDWR
jgi:hypothetical protein